LIYYFLIISSGSFWIFSSSFRKFSINFCFISHFRRPIICKFAYDLTFLQIQYTYISTFQIFYKILKIYISFKFTGNNNPTFSYNSMAEHKRREAFQEKYHRLVIGEESSNKSSRSNTASSNIGTNITNSSTAITTNTYTSSSNSSNSRANMTRAVAIAATAEPTWHEQQQQQQQQNQHDMSRTAAPTPTPPP